MVTRIRFSFNALYAPSANSKEEDEEDEEGGLLILSLFALSEISLLIPNLMIRYDPFAMVHDTFFKELIALTSSSVNIEGIQGILLLSILLAEY